MNEDRLLLDTVADMTAASTARAELDPAVLMLVRIAALRRQSMPLPARDQMNFGAAVEAGGTLEDVRGVLVAVAPIIGGPRALSAAGTIATAVGYALAVEDALAMTMPERSL